MLIFIIELAVIVLAIYGITRLISKALKTAEVKNKVDELEIIELENKIVKQNDISNLEEKKDAIKKFKQS